MQQTVKCDKICQTISDKIFLNWKETIMRLMKTDLNI